MNRVIDLDTKLNKPKFMNNGQKNDDAVKLACCKCPYPVRESASIESKEKCRLWMKMVVDLLRRKVSFLRKRGIHDIFLTLYKLMKIMERRV